MPLAASPCDAASGKLRHYPEVTRLEIYGNDPYTVRLGTNTPLISFRPQFGGPFTLGGERCHVVLEDVGTIEYQERDEDDAVALRKLKGTTATFRTYPGYYSSGALGSREGIVFEPRVETGSYRQDPDRADSPVVEYVLISFPVLRPSVNGTYPGWKGWKWRQFIPKPAAGKE